MSNTCQRCDKPSSVMTGSYFNTDWICISCAEKERLHPDYEMAKKIENEQVRKGNYNFPGIGKPKTL